MVCCIICDCHDVYSPQGNESTLYRCNDESINKNLIDAIDGRFDKSSCPHHYFQCVLQLNLATTEAKRTAMAFVVCHNAPMICICAACGDSGEPCLAATIMCIEYHLLIAPCHILVGCNQCCIITFYLMNCLGFFKEVQHRAVPTNSNQPDRNISTELPAEKLDQSVPTEAPVDHEDVIPSLEPPIDPPESVNMER